MCVHSHMWAHVPTLVETNIWSPSHPIVHDVGSCLCFPSTQLAKSLRGWRNAIPHLTEGGKLRFGDIEMVGETGTPAWRPNCCYAAESAAFLQMVINN